MFIYFTTVWVHVISTTEENLMCFLLVVFCSFMHLIPIFLKMEEWMGMLTYTYIIVGDGCENLFQIMLEEGYIY